MSTWELIAYGTDSRYRGDVRCREYTTSARLANLWGQIQRIQWTDSGHGIVFAAKPHRGRRLPTIPRLDHASEELERLEAESKPQRKSSKARADHYEQALRAIASCESHVPGDVVDIARKSLEAD